MQITDASIIYPTTHPENFAGLVSLHEADSITASVGSGKPIVTLPDLYKNNFDCIPGNANPPLLIHNVCNGHSAISTAASGFLTTSAYQDLGDTFTIICVAALLPTATTNRGFCSVETAANVSQIRLRTQGNNFLQAEAVDSVSAKATAQGSLDLRDSKFHIFALNCTNALLSSYMDSIFVGSIAYVAPNPNVTARLLLCAASGLQLIDGYLAACAVYSTSLSAVNQLTLEQNYFRRKFFGTES